MENGKVNGISDNGVEDDTLVEDDIVEVIDVDENDPQEDVVNEMDMLGVEDVEENREDEEEEGMVITPERDDAKTTFSNHKGSVFCCDLDCSGRGLAVTGGEDDKAYVWNTTSGEALLECKGHKDSVTCVGFSHNGDFVATGDLSGLLQVWSTTSKSLVWSFEISDLEWLSWHPAAPVLLAGTVDGDIWMWKIPGGDVKTFQSFGCSCNRGVILPDGRRAVAGYEDGSIRVWDLKNATPTHTLFGHTGHEKSITSISYHNNNNLVLTGSTDCTAILLNANTGKLVSRYQCRASQATEAQEEDSVETVGLSNILPYAATGTLEGGLDIWDIPTQICRQHCRHEAGIVKLCWAATQPLVYTSTLDGVVHLWDSRSGKNEQQWLGHQASILDLHIGADGRIITTSDDQTARVFFQQ